MVAVESVMTSRFSENSVPLSDLKVNPGRVVKRATEVPRPVLLTSRGRGVAVVQSIEDCEQAEEERAFMRAVVVGLADLEAGREVTLVSTTQPSAPTAASQSSSVVPWATTFPPSDASIKKVTSSGGLEFVADGFVDFFLGPSIILRQFFR